MASKIFISYRRDDDPGFAHAIHQRLRQEFPGGLFMDVEGRIRPGDDFATVLNEQVEQCDVLLAVIGRRWINARDEEGDLRLWKDDDFVRIEIASALGLGKLVIPVLVNGAQMPGPGDLPPSLTKLTQLQAEEIRPAHFSDDTQRLTDGMKEALKEIARKRTRERWERELNSQKQFHPLGLLLFFGLMAAGFLYVAYNLRDVVTVPSAVVSTNLLLFGALVIALGFEFVNGFHDTANAVATVIYTHSLEARVAVVWSGVFNFLGVLAATGGVAFSIVSLLPVDLILQVGSTVGFAMVFALLIAAVIWNLSTWYLGLPASSSHTLIGSIIGIGIGNALIRGQDATAGVDWSQAMEVGRALLLSPVAGFAVAALLLGAVRFIVRIPALYEEPKGKVPPPWWIRLLLILTCTGVSYAHGSNDGQKGMGLIMLILIVTPMAYAPHHAQQPNQVTEFQTASAAAAEVIEKVARGRAMPEDDPRSQALVTLYVTQHESTEDTYPALLALMKKLNKETGTRKDMYLVSEAIRLVMKEKENGLSRDRETSVLSDEIARLDRYKRSLDNAMKFIPDWVTIAVALALGLGTVMGWKRIVVTVGEKIGKTHLTYAQGASAEFVTAATVGAANLFSLPVSTTHVLSSGVAGAMAANGSGLQWGTIVTIVLGWVLTLPVAIVLSATLYWAFSHLF